MLVTGGTAVLGRLVVARPVRARRSSARAVPTRWRGAHVGDLNTGAGVADAARGVELIVHAVSDTQRLGRTDLEQTAQLLDAARDARHLVYVSVGRRDRLATLIAFGLCGAARAGTAEVRLQTIAAADVAERSPS
jgi:hypothetical protein